jgi:hypothetical protein
VVSKWSNWSTGFSLPHWDNNNMTSHSITSHHHIA